MSFDQEPSKRLSDYIIGEVDSEEEAISDLSFNTEDNQKISNEDIRICTDPASPFFMRPEGEGLSNGPHSYDGFDTHINDNFSSNAHPYGFDSSQTGSVSDFGTSRFDSISDLNVNDVSSDASNVGNLPFGFTDTLPKEEIEVLSLSEDKMSRKKIRKPVLSEDERKVKPSKETTNKLVILLVAAGALLMMWYTTFAQPLATNSKQVKLGKNDGGSWDIRFTDMYQQKKIGSASEISSPIYNSTKASFHVLLSSPGDEITYNLTIKNNGTLNAKVSSIYVMPENREGDAIVYFVDGINVGDILDAGQSTNMTVTAKFNPSGMHGSEIVKNVSVIVNYVQR